MALQLNGLSIAILAANGFDENQVTEIQRELTKAKGTSKIVAPENGVVNGWQNDNWGHYFPVGAPINEALGSDYDALIIPGGERAVLKLKSNPHSRRIINHFLEAGKPIAAIGAGVSLLALSPMIADYEISASAETRAELTEAKADIVEEPQSLDRHVLTATGSDLSTWVSETMALFGRALEDQQVAA